MYENDNQLEDPIQCTVKGAAFVASVGLGYITFDEIPDLTTIAHKFYPNPDNRAIYDKLFKQFVNIYYKNKKIYQILNSEKN